LREHRGILVTLSTLAIVAALRGDPEQAEDLLLRTGRMADEAVDGPGMGAVLMTRAEVARLGGDHQGARDAVDAALRVFYGDEGILHASWLQLQHAHLSLEVGEPAEAARRLELARAEFTESGTQLGLDYCAAMGALTAR
jgi:ATP/maltotriose-dependent transcriptional regulator MalT